MSAEKARIAALCGWFRLHARKLPWRDAKTRNGYTALVSEAMLQQTQVARVIESYKRFMERFPTVGALAAADEQHVLAAWRGLGYYRRARNLHAAAKMIVDEFGGKVPRSVEDLCRLPGVGLYTAGAIASIAYGKAAAIVDGNVRRVLARWFAEQNEGLSDDDWAWSAARGVVQLTVEMNGEVGMVNESLMELGAMVCVPKAPRCAECPVAKWCIARSQGLQELIPAPRVRAKPRPVHHHAILIVRSGKILLQRREGDAGMWSNMWQTPTIESDHALDLLELKQCLPFRVSQISKLAEFKHQTTHRRSVFMCMQRGAAFAADSGARLVSLMTCR